MRRRADERGRPGPASVLLALLALQGCMYSFRGGSFPDHIRTIAVLPFENETTRFEVQQELFQAMRQDVPRNLGIRPAGEDVADAVLRGRITRYEVRAPNYRPGGERERVDVLQREVTVTLAVEMVDLTTNTVLWEDGALQGQGHFQEDSETEEVGRQEALELLVRKIVDGAQSRW